MRIPVYFDFGKTLPVAHRGLSFIERENTMPAFVAAANRPYFGIETDIHITSDGRFICCHDHNTERVAAGDKLEIEATSLGALRGLMLTDIDGSRGRCDLRLPELWEYITVCRDYGKHSVLELKGAYSEEALERVIGIIKDMGHLDSTTFIAFDINNLIRLRGLLPKQSAQFLTREFNSALLSTLKEYSLDLDIHHKALNAENVALLHENGIVVNTWTVDDPERAAELVSYGVDQITSNKLCPRH